MNDTTQLIEELRLIAHAESLRVTADKLVEAAMKIEGQQKSINELIGALEHIRSSVSYALNAKASGGHLEAVLKEIDSVSKSTIEAERKS